MPASWKLAPLLFLFAPAAPAQENVDFPKNLFSSGEYSIEQTYVGEAAVRSGHRVINDFDESDTILHLVLTPRIKYGVLRFGAEWEHFAFGFPRNTPLPNTLQSANAVMGLDTRFSDSILVRFEITPGFYGTNNLEWDKFNIPFVAGGTYIYNPDIQIILGVSVDVERKYPVIPGAGIRWKVAPQWVVNAVMPKPRLEYEWSKSLRLYIGATLKSTSFRTDDDFGNTHGKSRLNHAALTYSEVRTGIGFDWKINNHIFVTAEAGYEPYRSFDYFRTDLRFHEDGSAPYGRISVHGAF